MPLPTLLLKGNLRAVSGDAKTQAEYDKIIPMDYIIDWIKAKAKLTGMKNRFIVLKAQTASGKSTANLGELYLRYVRSTGRGMICTQPRTLTAKRNVREITSNYKDIKFGVDIGHSTKYDKFKPKPYGILSATIGTLTQQLKNSSDEDIMSKYSMILIDETHERDLQIDMTLYMLRNFLERCASQERCPFIMLMSATFDPQKFVTYFGGTDDNFVWVSGRSYEIEERWGWRGAKPITEYPKMAAEAVEHICRDSQDQSATADVLIFMPGAAEIDETVRQLDFLNKKFYDEGQALISVSKIDSKAQAIENFDYKKLDIPVEQHKIMINRAPVTKRALRRVIISTNIAETGLTLENLKYVVDSGYNKEVEFNPVTNTRVLISKPAPKSRITQRRGRSGRKFPGVFYPLYSKEIYAQLQDQQYPQILLDDVSVIILDIIVEQLRYKQKAGLPLVFRAEDINMIDVPTADMLQTALAKAYSLGFLMISSGLAPNIAFDLDIIEQVQKYDKDTYQATWPGAAARREGGGAPASKAAATAPIGTEFIISPMGLIAFQAFNGVPLEYARMILAGYSWEVSIMDLVTIAAWCQTSQMDLIPKGELINYEEIYAQGGPAFLQDPKMVYRVRMLAADDFLDGIFVLNAVRRTIHSGFTAGSGIAQLTKFCAKANLKYEGVLKFLILRDEILERMLMCKMNVFFGNSGPDGFADNTNYSMAAVMERTTEVSIKEGKDSHFTDLLIKLKYCIYDGMRGNIARLDRTQTPPVYRARGLNIIIPKIFVDSASSVVTREAMGIAPDTLPDLICYNQLDVKYKQKKDLFVVTADRVSVMSGYVHHDSRYDL